MLGDSDISYDKLIPITLHGDGAVMKREDECFVFSMSSAFSASGSIKEVLMLKCQFVSSQNGI